MSQLHRPEHVSSLCIIVPVLDERQRLPSLVEELASYSANQLIIVDGGSQDGSYEWLEANWLCKDSQLSRNKHLIRTQSGRAKQMNAGVKVAQHDWLLFLHADTTLPQDVIGEINVAGQRGYQWGRFDVAFHSVGSMDRAMRIIAFFINLRSRVTGIATGDQAMFMTRARFSEVQGFDDIALMEDVSLSKKMRVIARPFCSRLLVQTSPRRWQCNGVFKTVLIMWWYRLAYFCGVSPDELAKRYHNVR